MSDSAVKWTADDSIQCKANCTALGYLTDPYNRFFAHSSAKRPPIINRGYWARVNRVWLTLTRFVERAGNGAQIISLGAGLDTSYWQLKDRFPQADFTYTEMDFPDVCSRKAAIIAKHPELAVGTSGDSPAGEILSERYRLIGGDLRNVESTMERLRQVNKSEAPTLVFAECVLVYLAPEHSDALIAALAAAFPNLALLTYDVINPNDAFGREMTANLQSRGIVMRGVHQYPSLQAHEGRLHRYFPRYEVRHMLDVYNSLTDQEERRR